MIELSTNSLKRLFQYKIVRYALVGGISTLIHISVAILYIYFINHSVLQSNISVVLRLYRQLYKRAISHFFWVLFIRNGRAPHLNKCGIE